MQMSRSAPAQLGSSRACRACPRSSPRARARPC
jgi:hypothetical protein